MKISSIGKFFRENISVLIILILIIMAIPFLFYSFMTNGEPVGGQRDENGCLISAGYSWNRSIGACIREWELNEGQRKASKIAVDYVGREEGLTVIKVEVLRCPGCFIVYFDKYQERFEVNLSNWKVVERAMTPEECSSHGGEVIDIVGKEEYCQANQTNIGKVTSFISPAVCCLEINSFEDCVRAGFPVMESYPRQCRTPGGRNFVESIEN